jgi:hypothetical protein
MYGVLEKTAEVIAVMALPAAITMAVWGALRLYLIGF